MYMLGENKLAAKRNKFLHEKITLFLISYVIKPPVSVPNRYCNF